MDLLEHLLTEAGMPRREHDYKIVRSRDGLQMAKWLILLDGEPYLAMPRKRQCRRIIRQHKRPVRIMVEL